MMRAGGKIKRTRIAPVALFAGLFVLFFSGDVEAKAGASSSCNSSDPEPTRMNGPEPWEGICEGQRERAQKCGLASPDGEFEGGSACANARQANNDAYRAAKAAQKKVCQAANAVAEAEKACGRASACQGATEEKYKALKLAHEQAKATLEATKKTMEKVRKEILEEVRAASSNAIDDTCRKEGHAQPDVLIASDPKQPGLDMVKSENNKIQSRPDDPPGADSFSPLNRSNALALKNLARAMKKTQDEIDALNARTKAITTMANTAQDRKNGLSTNPASTITGGDKPPNNAAGSSPPAAGDQKAPAGGGGSPSGGGSGSGGGAPPSNVSDASPSALPNGTSPTPDSPNNGGKLGEAAPGNSPVGRGSPLAGDTPISSDPKAASPIPGDASGNGLTSLGISSTSSGSGRDGVAANANRRNGGSSAARGTASGGGGSGSMGSGGGSAAKNGAEVAPLASGDSSGAAGAGGGGDSFGSGGGSSEDVLSPFGQPLGDPKFALAGSETDASVKGMLGEFAPEEGSRDLASEDAPDGIGERDGMSLFERMRGYHDRCVRKGCVSATLKRKVGGG